MNSNKSTDYWFATILEISILIQRYSPDNYLKKKSGGKRKTAEQ